MGCRLVPILLLLSACSTLPPPEPRPLEGHEAELVRAAAGAVARGGAEAEGAVRSLLREFPDSLDGRRLRENLRLARGEGFEVYEEARAAHEARPDDAAALYLVTRLVPDRVIQREGFRRVLELDPSLYYGAWGLAVVCFELRDLAGAEAAARRAIAIRPGERAARILLAKVLDAAGRTAEADEAFRRLVEEDPHSAAAALALADRLERKGRVGDALRAVLAALRTGPGQEALLGRAWRLLDDPGVAEADVFSTLVAADFAARGSTTGRLLGARASLLLGDAASAHALLEAAVAAGARRVPLREDRIEAAVLSGHYRRAREIWRKGLPAMLFTAENERRPALERLDAALLRAAAAPEPDALAGLATALSGCGFARLAAEVAPDRADLAAWEAFLAEVERRMREGYRAFESGAGGGDLDDAVAMLSDLSRRLLGEDVLEGLPVDRYPLVGAVLRTDRPGAPAAWGERGTLLVLGQRSGGPVEGTILRHVGRFADARAGGVPYTLSVMEGQALPSYAEITGKSIAGFTLPGWVGMNLDVTSLWEEENARLAAAPPADRPLWPAPDSAHRTSLWFPGGVRARLARAVPAGRDATLVSSIAHEEGHVADADDYLPMLAHAPVLLYELVRHGFSTDRIEVTLERNAQAHALRESPFPRAALLGAMSFLPWRLSSPPHSVAYHDLVASLVEEIDAHPDRYPSIDRDFNILQQLDRLTDEELRRLLDTAE